MEKGLKLKLKSIFINASGLLLVFFMQVATAMANDEEHLFKAAFIYNFAKFTQWPESVWGKDGSPLNLCTLGDDPLIKDLMRLNGKLVRGRTLKIISNEKQIKTSECHILYITKSLSASYTPLLNSLKLNPVLTISEADSFAKHGGMIELNQQQGQTQLIINLLNVTQANLRISSRLLMMAKIIDTEQP